MPKYQVIARPTGMKRAQPEVDITILAADREEAARRVRKLLEGRDEYIITTIKEVQQ